MTEKMSQVKVAVVQASPVMFDREATVEKTCRLVQEAAGKGAKLVLFPEAFIPAYPKGLSFGTVIGRHRQSNRCRKTYFPALLGKCG
jgi:nitrilase